MRNPLREMSRPKALGLAGVVAGAVAISGAAAALNVGLLTGNDSAPFTPQTVAVTADGSVTTTSRTAPPAEIVYQDVYEQAPAAASAAPAPATSPAPVAPASSADDGYDDQSDDGYDDDDQDESDDDHGDDRVEVEDHEDDEFDD